MTDLDQMLEEESHNPDFNPMKIAFLLMFKDMKERPELYSHLKKDET